MSVGLFLNPVTGPAGANGSVWRSGSTVPSNSLGVDGDFYFDTTNFGIYQKSSGAYSLIATLGSGSVTSVSATVPGFLTVSGVPITTSGTIAIGLATESANTVFAGPTSGGASTPTFRTLVAADLPTGNLTDAGTDGITVTGGTGAVIGSGASLSQHVADTTHNGYLSSADWNTFNSKQPAGNYITALTGDVTASGPGSVAATIAVGAVTDTKASLAGKPACAVAATSNQTLSGVPTIDGVALADGSLILLTAQSSGSENGPWTVHSGAWTRPTWFPSGGTTQAFQFITVLIRLGTTYQGTTWRMTAAGAITIDTTAQTWVVTPFAISATTITGVTPSANGGTSVANSGSLTFSGSASVTGTNTGDQTITLTSDVTGSGTGSFATTIAANAVTNAKAAQMAANTIKGNNTSGTANAADLTVAQVVTLLAPTNRTATATGNINATDSGNIVYVNPSAGITLTFPTKVAGQVFMLKDISGNIQTNNVTLARAGGSGKIENVSASYVWRTNFGEVKVYDDGTNYWFM